MCGLIEVGVGQEVYYFKNTMINFHKANQYFAITILLKKMESMLWHYQDSHNKQKLDNKHYKDTLKKYKLVYIFKLLISGTF